MKIKTKLHRYRFNLEHKGSRTKYKALCAKLKSEGLRMFNVLAAPFGQEKKGQCPAGAVELDCACLFDNQWNTSGSETHNGYRIFDWYECIYPNGQIKEGHYLEITDEMREIRRNTLKCGYCGHMEPAAKGLVFCEACLDSEYLKEKDLFLLRLMPVSLMDGVYRGSQRDLLSEAELAHLLPRYVERQTTGANSRNAAKLKKQRQRIEDKFTKAVENNNAEYVGMLWLMDHNWPVDNVLYYDHTSKFGFGWRTPLEASVVSKLLEIISEFPFPYEIKGVCPIEGTTRTWEGY
jgi:hypothetical protein